MPVEQALSGQAPGSCAQPLESQCKGYSGKGDNSLGVDNTGDSSRGERHEEARDAEGLCPWWGQRGAGSGTSVRSKVSHLCSSPPGGCSHRTGV